MRPAGYDSRQPFGAAPTAGQVAVRGRLPRLLRGRDTGERKKCPAAKDRSEARIPQSDQAADVHRRCLSCGRSVAGSRPGAAGVTCRIAPKRLSGHVGGSRASDAGSRPGGYVAPCPHRDTRTVLLGTDCIRQTTRTRSWLGDCGDSINGRAGYCVACDSAEPPAGFASRLQLSS